MPAPHDLAYTLPADAQYHIARSAIAILPPPPDPSPDAEDRRNNAFIARVADFQPQGSAEVELAAAFVTCIELARDAVLLSRDPDMPVALKLKCHAQAASMYRQANSASRELRHLKEARAKAASLPELSDKGERAEHLTTVLMAEGLTNPPPPVKLIEPGPDESTPLIVSPVDTKSLLTKTETHPRLDPPPSLLARTAPPAFPQGTRTRESIGRESSETPSSAHAPEPAHPTSISRHDPTTRKRKTETGARHSNAPQRTPAHPDPEPLVGAWRLAHLFEPRTGEQPQFAETIIPAEP